ncbi:ABC-type glycerol-3-phosphate transport system substrate-binding protein [Acholeplasma morum]|uniref:extracellular solute-binding protein n=1 Tax=Paracholeplasma morum TaxID=264637 RepID=UPI0019591EDC|nr:extracellular solute-binding protein [Paracholeplasma morum]MBM7453106.1 ABC-type glycerol-3-phosphate transport system substrate-binding protein [Paracholeplasma morum]
MKKIASFLIAVVAVITLAACANVRASAPVFEGIPAGKTVTITDGDTFDPKAGITAKDTKDKDLTASIIVEGLDSDKLAGGIWIGGPGSFSYKLSVTNSAGLKTEETIALVVNAKEGQQATPAVIEGAYSNQVYYIGSNPYNPLEGVSARDAIDGDLTAELKVKGTPYTARPGVSNFTIEVKNSAGYTTSIAVTLTVKAQYSIPTELTTDPITISFWHSNGDSIEAELKKYALSFQAKYPNITVEVIKKEQSYSELKNTVVKAAGTGGLPNLVQSYPDHVMEYLTYNALLSVSPYYAHPVHGYSTTDAKDSFADLIGSYRTENSQYTKDGDFYALPFNKSTEVLAYNKTVYDRLVAAGKAPAEFPSTWQDIIALAPAYREIANSYFKENQTFVNTHGSQSQKALFTDDNVKLMTEKFVPFSYDSTDNAFITLTRQWGGEYTGIDENRNGVIKFDNAQTRSMLQFFYDNKTAITVPGNWGDSYSYASDIFKNGFTFITIGSTGGIRYNAPILVTNEGAGIDQYLFEVGVAPMPYNKEMPENWTAIQQGTNISITSAGTEQQKLASWYFLKHLTSYDVQLDFSMKIGYSPVRTSVYSDPAFVQFRNGLDKEGKALRGADYLMSQAINAASIQKDVQFFDQAFVGSSTSRTAVGVAFNQVMLATNPNVINIAIQQAVDEAKKILGN